ncbi:hypothetical protein F2Q70_00010182 [Brassica cretica]|uniref:Uncharacterized protein n=1 Tax=Brassica cretica TaxID=69181 RepID=A0A8S9MBG4_BRACR|nr:hypothetical protein F2Q70_00010182 [Brassica cretica]
MRPQLQKQYAAPSWSFRTLIPKNPKLFLIAFHLVSIRSAPALSSRPDRKKTARVRVAARVRGSSVHLGGPVSTTGKTKVILNSENMNRTYRQNKACVQLIPNPRPDATVGEKKQARDSSRQRDPIGAIPRPFVSDLWWSACKLRSSSTPIKLSFRRSLSVINVLSLSSACVLLIPNPRPDATVREKKQARDSSWQHDPIGAVPRPFVSARL